MISLISLDVTGQIVLGLSLPCALLLPLSAMVYFNWKLAKQNMGKRLPEWGPFLWELLGRWIMHMGESKQQQRAWPSNNGQLWAQPGRLILLLTCQSSPQPGKRGTAARQQLLTGQRWPVRLGELDFTTRPPARPRIPPQSEHGYVYPSMPSGATWMHGSVAALKTTTTKIELDQCHFYRWY